MDIKMQLIMCTLKKQQPFFVQFMLLNHIHHKPQLITAKQLYYMDVMFLNAGVFAVVFFHSSWSVISQVSERHCCLPESLQWLQRGREPAILHGLSVLCLHLLQAGQWIDRIRCQHPQHLQCLDLWRRRQWWGFTLAFVLHCCLYSLLFYFCW